MSEELTATPRHLKACEVLDIRDGQGLRVKSLRGVLWITQSNDSEDIVVRDGQTFVLDRPGRGHMRKHISFTATAAFLAVAMIVCIKSAVLATNAGAVRPPVGLSWSIPGSSSYLPIHTLEEVY